MIAAFMRSYPLRSTIMLICLLFSGLSEGLGIASLLPLLNLAVSGEGSSDTPLGRLMEGAFAKVGLEPSLVLMLFLVCLAVFLKSGFKLIAMKQVGYTVAYVVTDLRLALLRAILKARWDYFISQPVGSFTNAISTEALRLSVGYRLGCMAIAEALQILFYLLIALLISWKVTLASLVVGGVIAGALSPLVRVARRAGVKQTEAFQSLLVQLTDLLSGIKPIKAMGRENQLGPLLESESRNLKKALQEQVLSTEMLKIFQEPLAILFMAIGIYMVLTHWSLPMTNLLVMALLFQRTVAQIGKLQKQYQRLSVAESAYWSFQTKLSEVESAEEIIAGLELHEFKKDLRFREISFGYGENEILRDVSFDVPFGKLVVFTGPSGVGKTTGVDIVAGLIKPQSGEIIIDGKSMQDLDLRAWRKTIGYVPQEMFLFRESVFNNVTLGEDTLSQKEVEEALKKAGAWDFVNSLPLRMDTMIGEHGGKISGGQRQRIALARALVHKPKLLILDEVTTALDPKTEADVCSTLLELREEMTILAISHQKAMISAADLVYRIENEKILPVENEEQGLRLARK